MTKDQQEIQAVREAGFIGYDKRLHSKCKKPEIYGIRRTTAAQQAIAETAAKRPCKDKRKLSERITCRMTKGERALLQQAYTASTAKTMQDYARTVLIQTAKREVGTVI